MYREVDVIKSGGIELCGMKTSLAPRRQQSQAAPKLEKYTFVPFKNNKVQFLLFLTEELLYKHIFYFFLVYIFYFYQDKK